MALKGALVRKALVAGNPVDQSIPRSCKPYPVLTFDQVVYDTEGCFDSLDSSFVVPAGVNYATFGAQVVWAANPIGLRQLVILRKSPLNSNPSAYEFFTADPLSTQDANSDTTTDMETHTIAPVPVVQGERYAVFLLQGSGGDLNISGGTGTVLGVQFF